VARGRTVIPIERCPRCALVPSFCICADLPRITTRTKVVIVRHVRELFRPSGTARIAALALPNSELIDYRDEAGALPAWLADDPQARGASALPPELVGERLRSLGSAHLLFPTGRDPAELSSPPSALVILDGTWRQARAMYQRIPGAAALPALRLPPGGAPILRLRLPRRAGDRSTLEAIADALRALEGDELAAPLVALHERFVERSLRARGRYELATRA